jgi:RNA polymerase sigma-54 factor
MKIGIGAKLTTGMTLTPQMQQAIRLLQLSSLELEQEVQLKLDSNPLLEREEEWETSYEDADNLPDGENYPEQDMDNDYDYDDDDYQVEGVELSEADLDDYTRHETEVLEDYLASDDFYPASASQDYPPNSEPSAVHEYASHSPSDSYSDSYGDKHRDSYADSDYRYDEEFGLDGIDSSEHLSKSSIY